MELFISQSANISRSLRGAKAHIAKSRVKVEDDEHESSIKKGEKFYLKKLGKKHFLLDVEKEGGKEVYYQFNIDKKTYDSLAKKHTPDSQKTTGGVTTARPKSSKSQRNNVENLKALNWVKVGGEWKMIHKIDHAKGTFSLRGQAGKKRKITDIEDTTSGSIGDKMPKLKEDQKVKFLIWDESQKKNVEVSGKVYLASEKPSHYTAKVKGYKEPQNISVDMLLDY